MTVSSTEFSGTDRFEICRRLGAGGMGVVYAAHDRKLRTEVALKTLRISQGELLLHLKNEFRAMQDIRHPNLVGFGELFEEGGVWFFTMELIDGVDFVDHVRPREAGGAAVDSDSMASGPTALSGGAGAGSHSIASGPTALSAEPGPEVDPKPEARTPRPEARGPRAETDSMASGPTVLPSEPQLMTAPGMGPGSSTAAIRVRGSLPLAEFDPHRLTAALTQLCQGLQVLHEAGRVHRDIKPPNVLVARDGRVVILDFGLVHQLEDSLSSAASISGTAAYMAPEQAAARPVGPPSDIYAVGVMLFQALTGRLPFTGPPLQIMMNKQKLDAPRPATLVRGVPAELDQLCGELLQFEPDRRPTAAQVLERLGSAPPPRSRQESSSSSRRATFVGRQQELELLLGLHSEARSEAAAMLIHGPSGVGKSELQRQLVRCLRSADSDTIALQGSCLEHELVPFKALDGVVDNLARSLTRLPREQVLRILPRHADVLARVFPVLQRIAGAEGDLRRLDSLEPHEARAMAFGALRALLAHLADLHPVLVLIDDIQWADTDSRLLLQALFAQPDAPACCLVATLRTPGETEEARQLVQHSREIFPCRTEELELDALSDEETCELARKLLGTNDDEPQRTAERAAAIAREAAGHPLFVQELVRHTADRGGQDRGKTVRLEDAIWERVAELQRQVRELVEVVAVAGGPIAQRIVMRTLELDPGSLARHLSLLRVAHLLRSGGVDLNDPVEPYHDRVREAVVSNLPAQKLRRWHRRLSATMESLGQQDPERMAYHLEGAGELQRAARYMAEAAGQAAEALALDRAARLYRAALAHWPDEDQQQHRLQVRLGDVLSNMGRSPEAAESYLQAAESAGRAEALELRCRVANQLIRGGYYRDGHEALAGVSRELGLRLPKSSLGALLSLLWRRLQIRLRGVRFKERDELKVSPGELLKVDICQQMSSGLSFNDHIRGADFCTRFVLAALRLGEPRRVCEALANEAAYVCAAGEVDSPYLHKLLSSVEELTQRTDSATARGNLGFICWVRQFTRGNFREALEAADELEALTLTQKGLFHERASARYMAILALSYLGQLAELERRLAGLVRDATSRGDLYALAGLLLGQNNIVYLNREGPARARQRIDELLASCDLERNYLQRYDAMFARCQIDLFSGQPQQALDRLHQELPVLRRSFILTAPSVSGEAYHLRARVLLALACEAPPVVRRRLIKLARKDARWLARRPFAWNQAFAKLTEAGIAALEGHRELAVSTLEQAIEALDAVEIRLYAAAARRRLGYLLGDAGQQQRDQGTRFMEQQGVQDLVRVTAMLAPGFDGDHKQLSQRNC